MSRRTTNLAFWLVLSLTVTFAATGALSYWRGFTVSYGNPFRGIGGGTDFGYVVVYYAHNPRGGISGYGFQINKWPSKQTISTSPPFWGWDCKVLVYQQMSPGTLEFDALFIHFSLLIVPLALWAYLLRRRYRRLACSPGSFPVTTTTTENPTN